MKDCYIQSQSESQKSCVPEVIELIIMVIMKTTDYFNFLKLH